MTTAPDTTAQINKDILALWAERFSHHKPPVHWPMICPEPVTGGLVVVGCNPALPKSTYYTVPTFDPSITAPHLAELPQLEAGARQSYSYYRPFHRLAADLDLPLEHIDLFFYRETKQEKIKALVTDTRGCLNDFGMRQVALAARLLALAQPKMVLVANAFSADCFKEHFKLENVDADGLYWITLAMRKVPVFLSSMLSGARPLDSHSRERLLWHMRKTLNSLNSQNEGDSA